MDYLDFEVEIGPGHGREYPVTVLHSPAGEASASMRFPFDRLALQNRLQALQIALLRSAGSRPTQRALAATQDQPVQDFGTALFDALLAGQVRSCYDVSRREADDRGMGLRLKLRIEPPELAALPWEYLYDPRECDYVCFSRKTPVVRYLDVPLPSRALAVTPPLRILGMVASPKDLDPLDTQRETQRLSEALSTLQTRGLVELHWMTGQTWRDLQTEMRHGPWHIFHFVGHGGFDKAAGEGLVALCDDEGQTYQLHAQLLGRLLNDHDSLRLVVLNACEGAEASTQDVFSSTAATLIRRGIPSVLAMQYAISDTAAIEFTRGFYGAVADSLPVDAAVSEARSAVSYALEGSLEWGTPVLYMRSPDGKVFDLPGSTTGPDAPLRCGDQPPPPSPLPRSSGEGELTAFTPRSLRQGAGGWGGVGRSPRAAAAAGLAIAAIAAVALLATHVLRPTDPPPSPTLAASRPPSVSKANPPVQWTPLIVTSLRDAATTTLQETRTFDNGALLWSRTQGGRSAVPLSGVIASDFHLLLQGHLASVQNNAWWGAVFRYKDPNNFYYAQVSEAQQQFHLAKRLNGTDVPIIPPAPIVAQPAASATTQLSIRAEGQHFTFYVNTQYVGEDSDGDLTGGAAGLWVNGPAGSSYRLSEFDVYVP